MYFFSIVITTIIIMFSTVCCKDEKYSALEKKLYSKNYNNQNIDVEDLSLENYKNNEIYEKNINFNYDSSNLTKSSKLSLDKNIKKIKIELKDIKSILIEGHTDERGSSEYNIALGELRANSVKNYLIYNNIPLSKINIISYGKEKPISFGHDENSWNINRRVEFKIKYYY